MNTVKDIYLISLKSARRRLKKAVRENEQCYNSLKNKDNEYARIVKALGDLHRSAYEIYKNAPDELKNPDTGRGLGD